MSKSNFETTAKTTTVTTSTKRSPRRSAKCAPKRAPTMLATAIGNATCHQIAERQANKRNAAKFEPKLTTFALPEANNGESPNSVTNATINSEPVPGPKKPSYVPSVNATSASVPLG